MAKPHRRGKARAPRSQDHGSKAEFIRQHADLSPKEVVEAAARQGLMIHLPQVYNLRAASQRRKPAAPKPSAPVATPSGATVFRRLVLELGVAQARALVDEVEAKLEALISGR